MSEESERVIRHRAELLSGLLKQEGFQVLEHVLRKKEQQMSETFWTILMADEPPPNALEQLAFYKGFFRGMRYAISVPKGAEETNRQFDVLIQEDDETEIEDRWSQWALT